MTKNYRNRHIRLDDDSLSITLLEAFLDSICDDFHIYDEYYGNIISCVTEAYDMMVEMRQQDPVIDIYFIANKRGITFKIVLKEVFLVVARTQTQVKDEGDSFSGDWDDATRSLVLINALADNVIINNEDESLEIIFNVTGVNDFLTHQRQQLLYDYYEKLVKVKKTLN